MSFATDAGYIPKTIEALMDIVMVNWNLVFSKAYTTQTFIGSNVYKNFYAIIQELQANEVRTSEIVLRLMEYFNVTNENIQRPKTTHPGIIDFFAGKGYLVSTKPPIDADAGKAYVCIDVDDDDDDYLTILKPLLGGYIKDCVVGGVISQGTEEVPITLTNGQQMTFKYNLPTAIPVILRLTTVLSDNNEYTISSPADQKAALYANIVARYKLGRNFEPQRYFSLVDAPWAESVLLEWSSNGGGLWHSTVYTAAYNEVFTFALTDITLVES